MRIEGKDASGYSAKPAEVKPVQVKPITKENIKSSQSTETSNNISISQISDYEIREMPVSERVVIEAIQRANKAISGANTKFEFSVHKKTKEIMVKVIDSETNEVIREIPPEKILDMVAKMWEMAGIIVDERR